jgi:cytochrome c2
VLAAACGAEPGASPTAPAPGTLSDAPADLEAEYRGLPAGDPANGAREFTASGCAACHALEADKRIVGPSLAGIASAAAAREPDLSAELYLYKSITRPDSFVAPGYTPGLMPKTFVDTLPAQALADLIAYLLTLN